MFVFFKNDLHSWELLQCIFFKEKKGIINCVCTSPFLFIDHVTKYLDLKLYEIDNTQKSMLLEVEMNVFKWDVVYRELVQCLTRCQQSIDISAFWIFTSTLVWWSLLILCSEIVFSSFCKGFLCLPYCSLLDIETISWYDLTWYNFIGVGLHEIENTGLKWNVPSTLGKGSITLCRFPSHVSKLFALRLRVESPLCYSLS